MRIRGNEQIIAGTVSQTELGLIDPINPTDAVTYRVLLALAQGRALKFPCRCATVSLTDVPFSSYASNTITATGTVTTLDGITLAVGDRVLLKNYTGSNAPYNGIYTYMSTTGTAQFTRSQDANTSGSSPVTASDVVMGMLVPIDDGTTNGATEWTLSPSSVGASQTITLNTTSLNFIQIGRSVSLPNCVTRETPSGTVNGSNTNFVLAHTPISGSESVFLNGLMQNAGGGNDYTISAATITFITAPLSGDLVLVSYRY
jgi:hypothetical protein